MGSNNNRQLINSFKQLNPMSAAENVLSMRKYPIEPTRSRIKKARGGGPISSEVPCFISKGGPCMKQVPVDTMLKRVN